MDVYNVYGDLYGHLQWLAYRFAIVNSHTDLPLIFYLLHIVWYIKLFLVGLYSQHVFWSKLLTKRLNSAV